MAWDCIEYGGAKDAPREKLLRLGGNALSDSELLALFLRTGIPGMHVMALSNQVMNNFGSLYNLFTASYDEFCAIKGLGLATYAQLQAVLELAKRYFDTQLANNTTLISTTITKHYVQTLFSCRDREAFIVIYLDNGNHIIKHELLFYGTLNSVEIHPRIIIRNALKYNAAALILSHNHPSGLAEPSEADRRVTEKICQSCELVDVVVLDHIVVGQGQTVSFAERGWL